jgi:hypothetical protein
MNNLKLEELKEKIRKREEENAFMIRNGCM